MVTTNLPGALYDLRVIELCDESGQYLGKILADLGADVIKVEPSGGDPARRVGPFVDDFPHPERSLYFWHYNTNKRSISLNLDNSDARAILRRLVASADIVIESYPPGFLEGLGLGYDDLSQIKPDLIMTSITGFGQTGPYRDYKTSDLVALGLGGPMASCGYDDIPNSPPIRGNGGQGFHTGAHYAAIGTLMAVYHRDITGEGQYVDASIHESLACTTEAAMPQYMYLKNNVKRQTGRHHAISPTPAWQYLCTDGRYVCAFGLPRSVSSFMKLLELMEAKGVVGNLREDRYREAIASGDRTGPESQEIMAGIGRFIEVQTAEEAYHAGQQIGLPWGLIRAPEETLDDPHLHDRGFFVEVEHPEMERSYTYTGTPYIFSESPWRIGRRAPLLGEDNQAVYADELGLSKEEIVGLYETGAI